MKNNKYFTPNIEDVHIGFECEVFGYPIPLTKVLNDTPKVWYPKLVDEDFFHPSFFVGIENIRVPYLTKEQIEGEGWIPYGQGNDGGIVYSLFKNSFKAAIWKDSLKIEIQDSEGNILFNGECKDINTFRKICKLLKI